MNGQDWTPYLDQPLTEAEEAERTRLHHKARLEEKLYLLAGRLGAFHRARYSRWAALNALLPRCYRAAWGLPLAHTPRLHPSVPIQPGRLCLTNYEYSHLEELDNRHHRPFELERHRYNPAHLNGWIGRYDRKKQALTPEANLAQFAADELRDFEVRQAEEDARAEGARAEDPTMHYLMREARKLRADEFRQHVAADLGRVGFPVVGDGLEQHGREPAATMPAAIAETSLADYLADKCSLDLCDKAAKLAGLLVGKGAETSANLRIHALACALDESHSLRVASIGMADFRLALAARYGVPNYNTAYRPQHEKGPNQRIKRWDDAKTKAHSFLTNQYGQEPRRK